LKTTVRYLGYEIQAGEIRPSLNKMESLVALPTPKSVASLRQLIGLASYFRQFIPRFSQLMKPFCILTSEENSFDWQTQHEQIRSKIISVLISNPVLIIFDPRFPIELHTDASSIGYGAILLHRINSKPHLVKYFSRASSPCESRYTSYELETLAVVNAVKHFRHYLHARKFVIFTDSNSIKSSRNIVKLAPTIYRWWEFLQTFGFEIEYREGKRMAHVDLLSRNPVCLKNKSVPNKIEEKRIDLTKISENWILVEQHKDPEISEILTKL